MTVYNYCPNPSFESGTTAGYTALAGTELYPVDTSALYGRWSMQVSTAGTAINEGFYGPQAPMWGPASLTISLSGESGFVDVIAVSNPGGVVLAQQTVYLTNAWQTVKFNDLTVTEEADNSLYVLVQTTVAQDLNFHVDGVMYENVATCDDYIDGDSISGTWSGETELSWSYVLYPDAISAAGGMYLEGHAEMIVQGEVFQVVAESGSSTLAGTATEISAVSPPGAMTDFAIWPSTDVDPALSYVSWNNANALSGKADWQRVWGIFYPPLDYPNSTGENTWNRAAYMALGWEFVNVAAGAAQNMTWAQVELMPLAGVYDDTPLSPTPSPYDPSRISVKSRLKL